MTSSSWSEHKLGDLIQINPDALNKTYPYSEIEYLDISSVGTGFYTEVRRLKLEEAPSRAKRLVSDGDTIISTVRPGNKSYCYLKKTTPRMVVSTGFAVLRAKKDLLDERFLYYLVSNPAFTEYLVAHEKGAAYPAVGTETIENAIVNIPDLPTQKKISDILGSLDDKIELNRRMNETLEQMAMALYKHWFVDGEVYQDVPNGKVEDFAKIIGGGTPKTSVDEYWGGDIPWVSVKDLSDTFVYNTEKTITEKGLQESSTKLIPKHATIVSARGTVGELSITGRPMAMNQSCYAFYSNELPFFTYLTLKFSIDTLKKNSHGSVFSTITRETINLLDVPYDPDVCSDFEKKVDSLFFQIDSNIRENMILTQTRDYLLPRLLSGEIEVREAEEQVEEVLANA
jgi:type I restriction enzyme S subunit